jgi:hypothetical protein
VIGVHTTERLGVGWQDRRRNKANRVLASLAALPHPPVGNIAALGSASLKEFVPDKIEAEFRRLYYDTCAYRKSQSAMSSVWKDK